MFLRRVFSEQYLYLQGLTQERSQNSRSYNRKRFEGDKQVITSKVTVLDFSQVCERSSQWCELRYSQVQTAH